MGKGLKTGGGLLSKFLIQIVGGGGKLVYNTTDLHPKRNRQRKLTIKPHGPIDNEAPRTPPLYSQVRGGGVFKFFNKF